MTFTTGPSLAAKTTPIIDNKTKGHVVAMCKVHVPPGRVLRVRRGGDGPSPARMRLMLAMTLCLVVGFAALVMFLPEARRSSRFHGFCRIPIREDDYDHGDPRNSPYHAMSVRWLHDDEADVEMFESGGGNLNAAEELMKSLRERFDVGDQVEKISVMDNGKKVNFIHDFEMNTTEIEDTERCFTSELDHETVLQPSLLLLSIEDGAVFDVRRVRSALAAELPALRADALGSALRDACDQKPVYRLVKQDLNIIRKRSADAPAHDFIQFSGRGIQEIEISNLAEILQHEQDAAIAQP